MISGYYVFLLGGHWTFEDLHAVVDGPPQAEYVYMPISHDCYNLDAITACGALLYLNINKRYHTAYW